MAKNNTALCSNCEYVAPFEVVTKKEKFNIRGQAIEVGVDYRVCSKCNDIVFDADLHKDPFDIAYRVYRKQNGMLQPEDIKSWRKKYNISQYKLAKLLNIGIATLNRYENGALQDKSHDNLMKLAMQPSNLVKMLQEDKDTFTSGEKANLLKLIKSKESDDEKSEDCFVLLAAGDDQPSEYNGNKKFDFGKLANLIKYLCKEGEFPTKLNKLLFYIDFLHYRRQGSSVTGLSYVHLPYGPVPQNYDLHYATLLEKGILRKEESIYPPIGGSGEVVVGEKIVSERTPDWNFFSATEHEVILEVEKLFSNYSANQMKDISHKEEAYIDTKNGDFISYEFAKHLKAVN